MTAALTDAQWTALRELWEGELATLPRLARAAGAEVADLLERAEREGWRRPETSQERLAAIERRLADIAEMQRIYEALPAEDVARIVRAHEDRLARKERAGARLH